MKKYLRIGIILVLAALVVLTFISRTVYHSNLPQVSAVTPFRGFVPITHIIDTTIPPHEGLPAIEWLPHGTEVTAGDIVVWYDTRLFDLTRRELELAIRRLDERAETEDDMYELDLLKGRLALHMENTPPPDGLLLAPHDGTLLVMPGAAGMPAFTIRNTIVEDGASYNYIVPLDAIFQFMRDHVVYVIDTRPGPLGPEEYVTMIIVEILRENQTHAAINPSDEGTSLQELRLAINLDGFINDGDTVWVRER